MAQDAAAAKSAQDAEAAAIHKDLQGPPRSVELRVQGNQIVTVEGSKSVWLQGLDVDSMQWGMGERILQSIRVGIDQWHANVIRLPVNEHFWFAKESYQKGDPQPYRTLVDQAVQLCAAKGAYLVIDLHRFRAPTQEHVDFWKDVAERYKNNPAVLFELFNEPHDISWDIWKNGGTVTDKPKADSDVVSENSEALRQFNTPGMQALIDTVRQTGARNIVIVGGLDWSYDLSGIVNGYALDDRGGNGIVYSTHIYPWKSGWQKHFLDTAARYPLFIGEVGCPEKWEDFPFIPQSQRKENLGPGSTWANDVLGMIQQYRLNWTGFSFHPRSGPPILKDWSYAPTEFWGVFVKKALAGQSFEMGKMR